MLVRNLVSQWAIRMKIVSHTTGERRDGYMISAGFEPKRRFRLTAVFNVKKEIRVYMNLIKEMKVTKVEVFLVGAAWRNFTLVKIETDSEIVGWGEGICQRLVHQPE